MKTLTVAEALIALGNGEKVTSDNLKNDTKYLYADEDRLIDGEGDTRCIYLLNDLLVGENRRIYEEFTYPMWFESENNGSILKYTGLSKAEVVVKGGLLYSVGYSADNFLAHTSNDLKQVEEPKKMIKVAKYAYFHGKVWVNTDIYYKNDEDFSKNSNALKYKRLDYTEIEVEDY